MLNGVVRHAEVAVVVFTAASLHSIEPAEDDATEASWAGNELHSVGATEASKLDWESAPGRCLLSQLANCGKSSRAGSPASDSVLLSAMHPGSLT